MRGAPSSTALISPSTVNSDRNVTNWPAPPDRTCRAASAAGSDEAASAGSDSTCRKPMLMTTYNVVTSRAQAIMARGTLRVGSTVSSTR